MSPSRTKDQVIKQLRTDLKFSENAMHEALTRANVATEDLRELKSIIENKDREIQGHLKTQRDQEKQIMRMSGVIEAYEKQLLPLEKRITLGRG